MCFVRETSWGHRGQGLWREDAAGKAEQTHPGHPGQPGRVDLHLRSRPQNRGKVCFSFVTPGDRAGEVRANGTSCSGVGMPHRQGFMQDWTRSCQHATVGIWCLQRAGPEQATGGKSSTMKTARTQLSGEPGELGTLLILWGSQLWRPRCRATNPEQG